MIRPTRSALFVPLLFTLFAGGLALASSDPDEVSVVLQVPNTGANTTDTTLGAAGVVAVGTINGVDGGHVETADAGFVADAGFTADAGFVADAGFTADAGFVADAGDGEDASALDATALDAQALDGTALDASALDATFVDTDGGAGSSPRFVGPRLAPLPYPCKLQAILKDGSSATTPALTCTSVSFKGEDQFGDPANEALGSISETAKNTSRVYKKLTSVIGSGCNGGADSGDVLRIACSSVVGIEFKPTAGDPRAQIEHVCMLDESANNKEYCYGGFRLTASPTGSYDIDDHAIDCSALSTNPSFTLAAGDGCRIRWLNP